MRLEFTYTLEDIDEALLPEAQATNPGGPRRKTRLGLFWWALLTLLAVALFWVESSIAPSAAAGRQPGATLEPSPRDLVADVAPTLLPAVLIFMLFGWILWQGWRDSRWAPPTNAQRLAQRRKRVARIVGVAVVSVTIGFILLLVSGVSLIWHPTRGQIILVALAPWAVNFWLLIAFAIGHGRWNPRRTWLQTPSLRRPKVVELDELGGFHVTDALSDVRLAWATFRSARETRNLLLLASEDQRQYSIPKRAFADPADLDRARALLQNMIPQTTFLVQPLGFPVAPKPVIKVN